MHKSPRCSDTSNELVWYYETTVILPFCHKAMIILTIKSFYIDSVKVLLEY